MQSLLGHDRFTTTEIYLNPLTRGRSKGVFGEVVGVDKEYTMANDTDVLLKFCEQYWEEMRHRGSGIR